MSSSFSLAKRRQVFALDLLQSILGQYPKMVEGGRVCRKSKRVIARIKARRVSLMVAVIHVPGIGAMSKKRRSQYDRISQRSMQVLNTYFQGTSVNGSAMLNAVLALVEDVYDLVPEEKRQLKRSWDLMRGSVATLYMHADPEMKSSWQELGARMCADLHRAVEDILPWGYGVKIRNKEEAIQRPKLGVWHDEKNNRD